MNPHPERHDPAHIAADIELIGTLEDCLVAVRRTEHERHMGSLVDACTTDLERFERVSGR